LGVIVVSIVPTRRTLWPVLAAEMVMLSAASLGHLGRWLTDGDRQWGYYAGAVALVLFLVGDATRRVTLDGVLDASAGSSDVSVGFRAPGEDEYRTPAGDVIQIGTAVRAVHVELDDLGSAVLVHGDPAFDDPAVRVQIERVMRLLANNVALLRQVDEQRRAMDDSRRRLLEADQHAAEVLLDDVGSNVLPHLSQIAEELSACGVPDDHKASTLLVQIDHDLRALSSGLGLDVLRGGLAAALGQLVDGCAIPARLDLSPVTMSQHHERVLFMVASEAVANAGKHSAAKHLVIELHGVGEDIELVVSDDGCGGVEHHADGGLAGLSDRVRGLGGRFEVDSPTSGGTVVLARLPPGAR
jgi:signal transduction histidine kinase